MGELWIEEFTPESNGSEAFLGGRVGGDGGAWGNKVRKRRAAFGQKRKS